VPRRAGFATFGAIGLAAGLFSSLFGVGGGIVMTPLLVLATRAETRRATATSLFAIVFVALFGAARYGWAGHVHWGAALLVGLPAVPGVVAGTALQRHVPSDRLTLLFAAFMLVIGVRLVIG
jgi:uncharacterized protein